MDRATANTPSTHARQDDPKHAEHRYFDCPVCGQRVDRKSLAQTRYHDDQPHEPEIYL